MTTTTHKTLRGPRGGMIMCKAAHAAAVNKNIFPGMQGGPLMHVIAAKAVAFKEALTPEFREYQRQIVANAHALAEALIGQGFRLVSGGTDTHVMLVDVGGQGSHGKGGGDLPGQRRAHGQQECHPLRHQAAHDYVGHPAGDACPHDPRHAGGRDANRGQR